MLIGVSALVTLASVAMWFIDGPSGVGTFVFLGEIAFGILTFVQFGWLQHTLGMLLQIARNTAP